ncbi:MAG TPA: sigma-70 family RNA polymerase sigma factor [Gammaproteobacteria bacterium]|nr:sigma-70 family RNA polymerase sigma factor [Gammaproteobacteria bacterium]
MNRDGERILDEYLALSSRAGSRAAFEELARRWTPRLLRYAARVLGPGRDSADAVREVVQDTWLGAIRGLNRLDDPARFPAWIYSIATRKCADAVRAAVRRRRVDARLESDAAAQASGHADDGRDAALDLHAAIARLPEHERGVVHLYYGEDLGVAEIAAVLGVPEGTVKSRLHHARDVLARFLEPVSAVGRIGRAS